MAQGHIRRAGIYYRLEPLPATDDAPREVSPSGRPEP